MPGGYQGAAELGSFALNSLGFIDVFVPKYTAPPTIPTAWQWGLIVTALVLLGGAKVYFDCRRTAQT